MRAGSGLGQGGKAARALWYWAPLLVPGCSRPRPTRGPSKGAYTERGEDPDEVDNLVWGRLERQRVLS